MTGGKANVECRKKPFRPERVCKVSGIEDCTLPYSPSKSGQVGEGPESLAEATQEYMGGRWDPGTAGGSWGKKTPFCGVKRGNPRVGRDHRTVGRGRGKAVEAGRDHFRQDLRVPKEGSKRPSVGGLGSDPGEIWKRPR